MTDNSNASRTMLFNINTLTWDEDILRELNIPASMLPEPKPSSCVYGYTDPGFFGGSIPIAGAAGDQQQRSSGRPVFTEGEAKNTYGTGCFLLMNTGEQPVFSKNGLVTTIAWGLDGKVNYALEGSIFVAGAAVQWLRDGMKLIDSAEGFRVHGEKSARDTWMLCGARLYRAGRRPTGISTPGGRSWALPEEPTRTTSSGRPWESIAYQVCDVIDAMKADAGIDLRSLKVDGGASANNFLMQFQADMLDKPVNRPSCLESTALGAAYLAGLAVGYWENKEDVKKQRLL